MVKPRKNAILNYWCRTELTSKKKFDWLDDSKKLRPHEWAKLMKNRCFACGREQPARYIYIVLI